MVRDEDYAALAIAPELAAKLSESLGDGVMLRHRDISIAGTVCQFYGCRWIGEGSGVLLTAIEQRETLAQSLSQQFDVALESEHAFHQARTIARFPWFGIDLDESNLPQEADRDGVAISFTKGCYLGQETVARLDALGQVQKKLVAWSIAGTIPLPGTALQSGDKVVGRLTSVAATIEGGAIAIGPARRSHFERGSVASGQLGPEGPEFIATVI
jgi:folate-binding protein YgfZ